MHTFADIITKGSQCSLTSASRVSQTSPSHAGMSALHYPHIPLSAGDLHSWAQQNLQQDLLSSVGQGRQNNRVPVCFISISD